VTAALVAAVIIALVIATAVMLAAGQGWRQIAGQADPRLAVVLARAASYGAPVMLAAVAAVAIILLIRRGDH
jgi:hypothetical protein